MKIAPFALEQYFAKYEFTARYLLSSSDCESLSMSEILVLADDQCTQLWNELELTYTETLGHPLLREAISGLYGGIGPDDVVVSAPEEGIFLLTHALLKAGDHVVCTFPGYQSLYEVARSIGCEVSTWNAEEGETWRFDVSRLEELLTDQTKLIVINFPHNPTGYVPPREDFERIVQLARERGAYLLCDEMYRFLDLEEGSGLPAACDLYELAFSLGGLSKTFGMPGLRIGWLASKCGDVLHQVAELKNYTTICSSAPSEILAIIGLRNRSAVVEMQLQRTRENLAVLETFMARHTDLFEWRRPVGGSICFPRILATGGAFKFCEDLVNNASIMLVPSNQFHFGDEHVRFGFGRKNLPEVLGLFEAALNNETTTGIAP